MNYKEMEKEDLRELALGNVQDIRDYISEEIEVYARYEILELINKLEHKVLEL